MVRLVLIIIGGIVVLEFLIEWLKSLGDEKNTTDYHYCYGCQEGFCMEIPGTKGCKKWEEENGGKDTRLDG